MPALLGAVILTDVTVVGARIRFPAMPGAAMQPAQQPQTRAPSGPWRVLTGIIAYTDPKQGFAMIGNSVQNTYLARPGDQLPDGSRIHEIRPTHIVLEVGGNLETVGIFEHEQPAGAVYTAPRPIPPMPQQARWEEMELKQATGVDATPARAARLIEQPPSSDTRASDTPANPARSDDLPKIDPAALDAVATGGPPPKQAQPQDPLSPTTQDPADDFGDDRRQRADRRK
jgi:Type II secretion system protein C